MMRNRLTNVFADQSPRRSDDAWRTDANPALRLWWLGILIVLPILVIAVRVGYLQTSTASQFAQPFEQTFVTYETMPGRDGRVLSADGRVLAVDRQEFAIRVHYRWLETPADPAWLKYQALARLTKKQRQVPAQVANAKKQVLADRNAMWERLAQITRRSTDEIYEKRQEIQTDVERIVALVEARRQKASTLQEPELHEGFTWRTAWQRFSKSITTPPARGHRDPVVIREELDHHSLLTGISLKAVAEIESHPERYPGVQISTRSWRDYPQDRLAAHLVGLRKPLTAEDLEKREKRFGKHDPLGYEVGDRIGQTGLEQMYDGQLHGLRGKRRVVRNRRGEILRKEITEEPQGGQDVILTLHAGLQERLETALDENLAEADRPDHAGASVVVLDVRTGAVLAAVSSPRFSLRELQHPTAEQWRTITEDPRRPLFHRVTHMAVAPGSIFKPVTAVALLESGTFDPDAPQHCQGFLDRPDRHRCYIYRHFGVGHGPLTLNHAICQSCNVYFFQGAKGSGPEPIVHWAERFGLGQPTGIDLPGERGGHVPRPKTPGVQHASFESSREPSEPWYPGDTLGLAIGQSRLAVTPLQMARVMAAIANDGTLITPHLVQRIGSPDFGDHKITIPEPRVIPGLSEETLARIREGLEMVVAHPKGTGYKTARLPNVQIAGKTGTAEVGGGKPDHAWFAGYAPAKRPKYAFAVVLEHAGSGGKNAGPIAKQTVQSLLDVGLISEEQTE